jgi:hypothetical protein
VSTSWTPLSTAKPPESRASRAQRRAGQPPAEREDRLAGLAGLEASLDLERLREVADHLADHQVDAVALAGRDHAVGVGQVERERLLAEHVHLRVREGDRLLGVQERRRADPDRVDLADQRAGLRRRLGADHGGQLLGARQRDVGHRDDARALDLLERQQVIAGDDPRADQTDP